MKGALLLAVSHARAHRVQTGVLALCIAVTVAVPLITALVVSRYEADLRSRAEDTPLIAGAKGSRFDLVFNALYFRAPDVETVPLAVADEINATGEATAIPINTRFTARDIAIAGVGFEYFEHRNLRPREGTLPATLGDAVLGSRAAQRLNLAAGDRLFSDQKEAYDISKPPALKMRVTGVLEPSGTTDDDAVFVDINTVWIIAGLSHGHNDVTRNLDPALLIGRTDDHVAVSQAMLEYNEVTPENAATYHIHADRATLPLTAIILFPRDDKSATLLKTRMNTRSAYQVVSPADVIDDLMRFIVRIRALIDTISLILAISTVGLIALVTILSIKARADEINTLHRIGCARMTVIRMVTAELAVVAILGTALAVAAATLTILALPNITALT